MTNSDNKITIDLNFKFQMKDYRLKFVTKRGWILALVLIFVKVIIYLSG